MNAMPPLHGDLDHIALALAEIGLPVFPCNGDKIPITKHGFRDASTDPSIIREMFAPRGAKLIGIPTGEASGFDALDLDFRHGAGGWYEANRHRLPETRVHETMSGGRHLLFRHAPGVCNSIGVAAVEAVPAKDGEPAVKARKAKGIAPGVDVRGEGGYVIFPPSPGYDVVSDAEIADWPEWLLVPGLALPKVEARKKEPVSFDPSPIPTDNRRFEGYIRRILANVSAAREGEKHDALRSAGLALGGIAQEAGLADEQAATWLTDALERASSAVRDWEAARKTALWALGEGRKKPIQLEDRPWSGSTYQPPPNMDQEQPPPDMGQDREDGAEAEEEPEDRVGPEAARQPPPRGERHGRLNILGVNDIETATPRDYLVKGIMSPAEISVWVGAPKCGKSFLLLHLAYMLSMGRSVFGRRVKQANVLYVAAEGEAGIANRIKALRDRHGVSDGFFFIAQRADLLHQGGHLNELKAAARAKGARLIVIDTLSRTMAGGDENSSVDMGQFVVNVSDLREGTGAHVAIVHHGTKSSGGATPRGHSALTGADDALVEITKNEDGSRVLSVVHAKDDADGARHGFTLDVVELGTDPDGDPITTLIVSEETGAPAEKTKAVHLSPTAQLAMRMLHAAMKAFAILATVGEEHTERAVITESQWRDWFYRDGMPGESADNKRQAFFRAKKELIAKAIVASRDDFVWPEKREV